MYPAFWTCTQYNVKNGFPWKGNISNSCQRVGFSFCLNIHDSSLTACCRKCLPANWRYILTQSELCGIVLDYGLDDPGSRVRCSAWAWNFSLQYRVQNGSGAHPAFYPKGTTGSFPGGKAAGVLS